MASIKTLSRVNDTFLRNLEYAEKQKWIYKPYSWALYQTWKTVNQFEKAGEDNDT